MPDKLNCIELCSLLDMASPAEHWPDITGVSTVDEATGFDLCFVESAEQSDAVAECKAALVLVPMDFPDVAGRRVARVSQPRQAFFAIADHFRPSSDYRGVHEDTSIDSDASLGQDVTVAPGAVIAAGVRVADGTYIGPGVYLGPGVEIGRDCHIHANVTVQRDSRIGERCIVHSGTNIGGDGFGYEWDGSRHKKVPQLGRVVIGDDVEIGSNVCVDRATLGTTTIGHGSKIDNLVQIAHNVAVGEHVILVSQCGVAGSSRIGTGCVIAGQAAISDHLKIGPGARIGGQAGVTKDVNPGEVLTGTPARKLGRTLREQASLAKLPEMQRQMKRQQRVIEDLEARLARLEDG